MYCLSLVIIFKFPVQYFQKFRDQSISYRSAIIWSIPIECIMRIDWYDVISTSASSCYQTTIIECCMINKSGHIQSSIGESNSEFGLVLYPFRLGEVDEILHGLEKFCLRNLSGSIVFAEDLEGTITISRQIVATIGLSIPRSYRQGSREVICETNGIHSIVSAGAAIRGVDVLAKSKTIEINEGLFVSFGDNFCF